MIINNLIKIFPFVILLIFSNCESKEKKLNRYLEEYTKDIEKDPDNSPGYYLRGGIYNEMGIYDKAIADYKKALIIDETFYAYNALSHAYLKIGKIKEALTASDKCINLSPDMSINYGERAICYDILGHPYKALTDYNKGFIGYKREIQNPTHPCEYYKKTYYYVILFRRVILPHNSTICRFSFFEH